MNFEVHLGRKVTKNYYLSDLDANAVINECWRQLGLQEHSGEYRENQVLHWKSAVSDSQSQSIDKGIIEELLPGRKIKLICRKAVQWVDG